MKKSLLLTLPLMATMLASCGGKGSGVNPNIPDPSKAKEEVAVGDATGLFARAAGVSFSSESLGLKLGVTSNANVTLKLPDTTESAKQGKIVLGKAEAKADETLTVDVNATGLDKVGFQNMKMSARVDLKANAYAHVPASTMQMISMFAPIELPATEGDLDLDLKLGGQSYVYSNGERAFFEVNEDMVNSARTILALTGNTKVQVMDAGKYRTPLYPDEESLKNFSFAAIVNEFVAPYLTTLPALVAQYGPAIAQICEEFKGLKYSDTEYAIYAKADIFKLVGLFATEYKEIVDVLNVDGNEAKVVAAIVFDTQKGLKSVGVEAKVDASLTYGQLGVAESMGVNANEKLLDAHAKVGVALEVKTGADVKVEEVTNPDAYQDIVAVTGLR